MNEEHDNNLKVSCRAKNQVHMPFVARIQLKKNKNAFFLALFLQPSKFSFPKFTLNWNLKQNLMPIKI